MALLKWATDPYDRLMAGRTINERGCWLSHLKPSAVGYVYVGQRRGMPKLEAHRLSYERNVGPIPDGLDLDHTCRDRACWNYEHVEPVTRRVNLLRGEGASAKNAAKTACPAGHPYRDTCRDSLGRRFCPECRRVRERKRRPAKVIYNRERRRSRKGIQSCPS